MLLFLIKDGGDQLVLPLGFWFSSTHYDDLPVPGPLSILQTRTSSPPLCQDDPRALRHSTEKGTLKALRKKCLALCQNHTMFVEKKFLPKEKLRCYEPPHL